MYMNHMADVRYCSGQFGDSLSNFCYIFIMSVGADIQYMIV